MVCYVPQERVGALCGLVGEFGVPLAAFVGGLGLMLFGSVEFQLSAECKGRAMRG